MGWIYIYIYIRRENRVGDSLFCSLLFSSLLFSSLVGVLLDLLSGTTACDKAKVGDSTWRRAPRSGRAETVSSFLTLLTLIYLEPEWAPGFGGSTIKHMVFSYQKAGQKGQKALGAYILYIPWESKTIKRMVFRGPERELPLLQPVKI